MKINFQENCSQQDTLKNTFSQKKETTLLKKKRQDYHIIAEEMKRKTIKKLLKQKNESKKKFWSKNIKKIQDGQKTEQKNAT